MNGTVVADVTPISVRLPSRAVAATRIVFMDNLRYLMVVLVVLYHAVGAYAIVAPHWAIHDDTTFAADIIRELLDVFIMPVLYFAAGYFGLSSLQKKGAGEFLKDKMRRLLVPWVLVVLVLMPLKLYSNPGQSVHPFWTYWLSYLGSFETGFDSPRPRRGKPLKPFIGLSRCSLLFFSCWRSAMPWYAAGEVQ